MTNNHIIRLTVFIMVVLMLAPLSAQEATDEPAPVDPAQAEDIIAATQQVIAYIQSNPDDVAIYCAFDGAPEFGVPAGNYTQNADEPFPLASAYKTVILAELTRQIDAGTVDPTTEVPLDGVNTYWLIGTDGGAHNLWLATIEDGRTTVTIEEVAFAMMRYSSNAAPDYLLEEVLGYDGFPVLFEQLGVDSVSLPTGTFLSLFLVEDNHETGPVDTASLTPETLAAERARLQDLYLTDTEWRTAELNYITERIGNAGTDIEADFDVFAQQSAFFLEYSPQGSAADMVAVMRAAYAGETFGAEAQAFMQQQLNWLFDVNPANAQVYDGLGSKGGSLAGISTGVWYVQFAEGPNLELAVFYRDVPTGLWASWAVTGSNQVLELRTFAFGEGCTTFDPLIDAPESTETPAADD